MPVVVVVASAAVVAAETPPSFLLLLGLRLGCKGGVEVESRKVFGCDGPRREQRA